MKTIRLIALLGAVLFTAGELLSLDYYTQRLSATHAVATGTARLITQR